MPILEIALVLAILSVAAFPCWKYSAHWGFGPSPTAGILLLMVAFLPVGGKSPITGGLSDRNKASGRAEPQAAIPNPAPAFTRAAILDEPKQRVPQRNIDTVDLSAPRKP